MEVAPSGASVAAATGGMESKDDPATAAVLSAGVPSAPTGAAVATRGGTGVVAETARDADGAMTLGIDRLSVSRALVDGVPRRLPLGGGMTSDGMGASRLGGSLGAVETTEGETGGGSAIVS